MIDIHVFAHLTCFQHPLVCLQHYKISLNAKKKKEKKLMKIFYINVDCKLLMNEVCMK